MLEMTNRSNRGRCFSDCKATDQALMLLSEVFPNRACIMETVEYFARGLEDSSADHKQSKRGYGPCKTKVRCKDDAEKWGSNELYERESTMNEGRNMKEAAPRGQESEGNR